MRTKKIIKYFSFVKSNYSLVTLGTNTRLNVDENILQLKEDNQDYYSEDPDLFVKTWVTNPLSVKQWLGFEALVTHVKDYSGNILTAVNYRLGDGTNEYYWNGSSWEINVVDWNTEAEVSNNISSFPVSEKKLQVILNLVTTDKRYTPKVEAVKILFASTADFYDDLIYRSLLPLLREELRPLSDYAEELASDSDTVVLRLENPYNVIGIDSCFNHTDDPDHQTDIFQSFNSTTKVVTLSEIVEAGKIVWVRFIYQPEVMVITGQEYSEVEKIPAVALTDITGLNELNPGYKDHVKNKDAGTAVEVAIYQQDIDVTLRILTALDKDQKQLENEVEKFFANNKLLTARNIDEKYTLLQTSGYDQRNTITQKELYSGFIGFRILKAVFYKQQEKDVYLVKQLKLQGDMNTII